MLVQAMIGRRVGACTILSLVGRGGMGEVYRARDTKLGREVAIKVLPRAVASDLDRRARLQREAWLLAALNHPRIATIHSLEEIDGVPALVLELVEGPTLAERLAAGPMGLDEVLRVAAQIAEALEAAHRAGIVHRDLKPANIKISASGHVKVLDFGLAQAVDADPPGDPSLTPTATAFPSLLFAGTPAYMSP